MSKTDIQIAKEAALKAKEIIQYYDKNRDKLNMAHKGRHDLVTKADVETEKEIISIIKTYRPDDVILGEETSAGQQTGQERTWIIDPIDGTTNFAHAFPVYCVSIALYENREPLLGVILEVNSGELFHAESGKGAFLNNEPISVSTAEQPEDALLGTGFPYRDISLIDDYLKLFRRFMKETHGVRRPGSASYDLACVAAGRIDGFYEYSLAPWDVAAGACIIKEAGGFVCDWKGETNWLEGERIIAGNTKISAYILKCIKEEIPEKFWVKS